MNIPTVFFCIVVSFGILQILSGYMISSKLKGEPIVIKTGIPLGMGIAFFCLIYFGFVIKNIWVINGEMPINFILWILCSLFTGGLSGYSQVARYKGWNWL